MSHATRTDDSDPWDGELDETHLFGDVYFVNKYRRLWWAASVVALGVFPPVGAFCLTALAIGCLTRSDADVDVSPK